MVSTSSILHFCPDFLQWWKYIYEGSVKSNKSFPFPPSLQCLCPVFYHSNKMESKTTTSLLNFWKHATKYKWIHLVLPSKQISHNKNIKSHFSSSVTEQFTYRDVWVKYAHVSGILVHQQMWKREVGLRCPAGPFSTLFCSDKVFYLSWR